MFEVLLELNADGNGAFVLFKDNIRIGEMMVEINWPNMIVYHTEVDLQYKGQGLAKLLFNEMVDYAKKQRLKVTPLCSYVHASFDKQPQKCMDIWDH